MKRRKNPSGAFDRAALAALLAGAIVLAGKGWLDAHPEDNPWAPLDLRDPPGWATSLKLAALRADPRECRAILARSGVAFSPLPPAGEGACARPDRIVLTDMPLGPSRPPATCAIAAATYLWLERGAAPAAAEILGSPLVRVEHLGTYSCRRLYGRANGPWSQHATGNAVDIAGFVLEDGRRISVLRDWRRGGDEAVFLHRVRDAACELFGTVLSPDYNAAHRDHLHLDQAVRGLGGVCR